VVAIESTACEWVFWFIVIGMASIVNIGRNRIAITRRQLNAADNQGLHKK
jgi:hypothetical protein